MQSYFVFFSLLFVLICNILSAQSAYFAYAQFEEQVLAYEPEQRAGVSDQKYHNGVQLLNEVKSLVKADGEFKQADYWNLSMAFLRLGEPNAHVGIAFQKAIDKDAELTCELIQAFGVDKLGKIQKAIPDIFDPFVADCQSAPQREEDDFDPKAYAKEHQLELELVQLVHQIAETDQAFREAADTDWSKQTPIDQRNMQLMDSLRNVYGGYVGKDLVGAKLAYVMWIVVQHSTIEQMQEYLPIVHQAVQEDQLGEVPLKMLLDRIHANTHGYQIFGSQQGVDMGPEDFCQEIKDRYDLN